MGRKASQTFRSANKADTSVTVFRAIFLAGLALFFATQQALCACAVPQAGAPHRMAMDHAMPAGMSHGETCDETQAPERHKSSCPHCGNKSQLIAQAAQVVPVPAVPLDPAPALFRSADLKQPAAFPDRPLKRALYLAAGPPRRTPLQLKTRFLN